MERGNRLASQLIRRNLSAHPSARWWQLLGDIKKQMNTSSHSEIRCMPQDVWDDSWNLWKTIRHRRIEQQQRQQRTKEHASLHVGARVWIYDIAGKFDNTKHKLEPK